MIASFSIVPIGIGQELKEKIAEIVPIIAQTGLDCDRPLLRRLYASVAVLATR